MQSIKSGLHKIKKYLWLQLLLSFIFVVFMSVIILTITENWTTWQAFWWTIVCSTTVGFGGLIPKSLIGQIWAIFVILFAVILLASLLGIIVETVVSLKLNRRKGMVKVKGSVDLTIIGYPNQSKVQSIVTEYRNDDVMHDAIIVCITDRLEDRPDWMVDDSVIFIKGLASSREVLERANIYEMDKIIVLANDPEDIASDDFTSSAVLMCEKLNPLGYTLAEKVRKELDLFDMCNCDHVVKISSGRELAHEAMNPGAIDLINSLFSTETPSTQRNFTITKPLSWYDVATSFLVKNATAIGYSLTTTNQSEFNFSPKREEELLMGTVIKYISDRTITEI